jgi:hypothetical protein
MLNNQYYKIYNESLLIIFDSLSDLLVKKEPFIENYTIYNNKKITDYMLFVRDFYKNPMEKNKEHTNIKNKSKYISILWKNLDKKEKLIYKIKAKEMLEYFKKNYQNLKKRKKKEKIKKEDEEILFNKKRNINNILKKIKIENVEYYIDCNNNLIDIEKEDYIGYLNDGIIHFFH